MKPNDVDVFNVLPFMINRALDGHWHPLAFFVVVLCVVLLVIGVVVRFLDGR